MDILEKSESVLKNHYIIFDNISFNRNINSPTIEKTTSRIRKNVTNTEGDKYMVSLELFINDIKNNFDLKIVVSGLFETIGCDDIIMKNELINKNAVSILFPYLRSEVTLLTSQPGIQPIIIPPININKLIEELEPSEEN